MKPGQMDAAGKAAVLAEAIPYIRRWRGKIVVIKAGGELIQDPSKLKEFAADVVYMQLSGILPVVVHGGGPQITERLATSGVRSEFLRGHRITDESTMQVVRSVLFGELNPQIVSALEAHGGVVTGVAGDAGTIEVARAVGRHGEDFGLVGEIKRIDPARLNELTKQGTIVVLSPLGKGPEGTYNVNADVVAGAVASALKAEKLVFLTNVQGLYRDLGNADSLISETTKQHLEEMLRADSLSEGMSPKIYATVAALRNGVSRAHILDGRVEHALLLEVFTEQGIGTMVLP